MSRIRRYHRPVLIGGRDAVAHLKAKPSTLPAFVLDGFARGCEPKHRPTPAAQEFRIDTS